MEDAFQKIISNASTSSSSSSFSLIVDFTQNEPVPRIQYQDDDGDENDDFNEDDNKNIIQELEEGDQEDEDMSDGDDERYEDIE